MAEDKLFNVKEVATYLNIHPTTVRTLIKKDLIPYVYLPGVGYGFKKEVIDNWIDQGSNKPKVIEEFFERLDLSDHEFESFLLEGGSAVANKKQRWSYGFGGIHVKRTKQGIVRWYFTYRDEEGRWREKVASMAQSKGQALIALQAKVQEVFDRRYNRKPKVKKIKFHDFADLYLEDYAKTNKLSWKTDRGVLRSMKKFINDVYLNELNSQLIEKYKKKRLTTGVQKGTVNYDLAVLRKMLNLAVEWGYLKEEEMPKFKFFSVKDNLKERILTEEEEKRLLETSSTRLRTVLIVALNTGMRRGEILSLEWKHIDFHSMTIRVENTKSGWIRYVNINTKLYEELKNLKNRNEHERFLFFNSATGKALNDVSGPFWRACRKVGIENLRFHDLRHTFASRLVKEGADIITVKNLLGHSSVTITERYTHSSQKQSKEAVERLVKDAEKPRNFLNISRMNNAEAETKRVSHLFSMN